MGFLTNISISNDYWHQIAENPVRLVEGISVGMNEGIKGPAYETFLANHPDHYLHRHENYVRQSIPQGVIVHKAEHYDTPQVIVNPYGTMPVAAHELPYAIMNGWLDLNPYNADKAEKVAFELNRLARTIRDQARKAKARKEKAGA